MNLDDTICYCFHVTKRKIVNFLRVQQPSRASRISECGGAGTGCGWCVPFLERYFREAQQLEFVAEDGVAASEYATKRASYLAAGKKRTSESPPIAESEGQNLP